MGTEAKHNNARVLNETTCKISHFRRGPYEFKKRVRIDQLLKDGMKHRVSVSFGVQFSRIETVRISLWFADDLWDGGESWRISGFRSAGWSGQTHKNGRSRNSASLNIHVSQEVFDRLKKGRFSGELWAVNGNMKVTEVELKVIGTQ